MLIVIAIRLAGARIECVQSGSSRSERRDVSRSWATLATGASRNHRPLVLVSRPVSLVAFGPRCIRLAALLLAQICPIFSVVARCHAAASRPSMLTRLTGRNTRCAAVWVASSHDAGRADAEVLRHPYEVGDGIGFHLRQHLMAMHLDGAFGDSQVEADLLVELAAD